MKYVTCHYNKNYNKKYMTSQTVSLLFDLFTTQPIQSILIDS